MKPKRRLQAKDWSKYTSHPKWIPRKRFVNRVRLLLARMKLINRVVDSIELARSMPDIHVEFIHIPTTAYAGQIIKGRTYTAILLNGARSEKALQLDCAHELGHYWFHPGVFELHEVDDIYREIMEWQAHWVARELKMPEDLFRRTVRRFKGSDEALVDFLSDSFFVTRRAVEVRLDEFNLWGAQRRPKVCELELHKQLVKPSREADAVVEATVQMDERGRVTKCLRCGNTDFAPDARFCKRCGMNLINECTYEHCNHSNSPDAAYCELCGWETTFFVKEVVNDWQGPYRDPRSDDSNLEDVIPF